MKQILPYINKKRNHAIFQGDFCVRPEINQYAFKCLYENISRLRTLMPRNCQQYFLVYINNIIDEEIKELTKALEVMEGFVGYGDMTYANPLKDLLAYYLGQCCIQIGNKVLLSHEDDRSNSENINLIGYDYEKFGFSYFSIQSYYYINYLEYKIESRMVDKSDLLFSLNLISEKIEDFNSYKIVLEPEKFNYIINKNLVLVESTGINKMQVEEFKEFLSEKIKLSYIYNLEINDHKVAKFNTIVECSTSARETVRLLVAFAYNTDDRTLRLLSLF